MKKKIKECKCEGCRQEMRECYEYQQQGYNAGLEFVVGHIFFFALDKKGKFVVPIFKLD